MEELSEIRELERKQAANLLAVHRFWSEGGEIGARLPPVRVFGAIPSFLEARSTPAPDRKSVV